MIKQFKDILDGENFIFKGLAFKKIPIVKISCCKSINAEESTNAQNKIFIQPLQEVEVNDQP